MSTDTLEIAEPLQLDLEMISPGDKAWGRVNMKGLKFNPTTSRDEWLEVMKHLCAFYEGATKTKERARFLLLDAIAFGESAFGEEFAQGIGSLKEILDVGEKSLANIAWVAKAVPEERRHTDTLSFTHHEIVAALAPEDQEKWLAKAEDEAISTPEFRKLVRAAHPPTRRSSKKSPPVDGKTYTETQVKDAFEILLTYFQPLTEKRAKATDEQKAAFGVQAEELAKILAKLNK